MIGLVDANNFYVSCERIFQPQLDGLPVGVMSNNDGCVIARSEELKALGVEMGTPAFQLEGPWQRGELHLLSSNYALYGDMSARLTQLLQAACPKVAPYSIDEMFLYLDGLDHTACQALGTALRQRIWHGLRLPVCVGLAPTHTLAKLANHYAKRDSHYQGACLLDGHDATTASLLKRTPVDKVWGIGRRLAERLALCGITTAWALRESDTQRLRRRFSVVVARTALELRGTPCLAMNAADEPRQRIMTSRSFGRATGAWEDLYGALNRHAQRSAEKLRQQKGLARAVMLLLHTNRHRRDLAQYHPQTLIALPYPTDDTREILAAVRQGLQHIYRPGYAFMKAGVMLVDLVDAEQYQMTLLNPPPKTSHLQQRLMATLDRINQRHGQGTITFGVPPKRAVWHLRCAHRSPRYTSHWGELCQAGTHPGAIAETRNRL
ncbi:Y-family DNA polymerase [Vreelandella massiliensis]|uniref:Y-family DNA polymerase n=1 Tax=Vreelandella massiliensis TaxID=1816686 RepID=UPI00096AB479|nr:Y-family DNA polymerase [Halomonas massiliensis]